MFESANSTHYSLDVEGVDSSKLQVLSFDGIEGLDAEYAFEITLVHERVRFDITQLLSKPAFLSFTSDKQEGIHGVIHEVQRGAIGEHYAQFKVILAPRFSHLYKRMNQRRWVDKTSLEIITDVLADHAMVRDEQNGFAFKLKDESLYQPREFCVQYDETDSDFIHRLCEEDGWAMSYRFSQNSHQLVFSDAQPFFPSLDKALEYKSDTGFVADYPVLKRFDVLLQAATKTASFRNYNFTNMKIPEGSAEGMLSEKANNAQEPLLESYNYPNPHSNIAQAKHYAENEIQRLRARQVLAEGDSDIPRLHAGCFFEVDGFPALESMDSKGPWLLNQVRHQGRQPQVLEAFGGSSSADSSQSARTQQKIEKYFRHPIAEELEFPFDAFTQGYRNCFIATPREVVYRPVRLHPKPQVLGSQTAIVVGPAGEEIFCDEYGRVKLQFMWDREGNFDEHSSNWVRVASNWAHDGYGAVVIPRVGMEVKVDFLEGDPEAPLVTGALHNGVNKVPYDLPANKTRSVFKTSSSKGGVGSNELRIEDKAGQEQIFVQAERNYDQLTKNNHTVQVNNNSHLQVNNEHSETIKANRYTHNKSEEHHLTDQNRMTQIMMNDYKTVGISEHETIGTVKTTEAGMEIHLKSGLQTIVDGGLSLTLRAGGQHIVLNPAGIWMTMPVWTGGIPMEGTPAVSMPPLSKAGSVAATSAPVPRPLTAVQTQTMASDAPFCLECMLNAMGICATDFSNKATPDAVLDTNSLNSSLGTPSFAGGLTDGLSSSMTGVMGGMSNLTGSMGNLTNMADMSNMANMTDTLQGLTKDPTQAIQQQATKAATDAAIQAVNSNETLKTATETVQQGADLANKAKQTPETLTQATTAATSLKTPDISSTTTGFNPNGGNNV